MAPPSLRISIGCSVDDLKVYNVNSEEAALISTDKFQGRVVVRIKEFTGEVPPGKERIAHTEYFDEGVGKGNTWSIQLQGRFLKDVNANDLVWGNQFEKPIRDILPWGTSVALNALGYIDPNLKHDIYADRPWAFSPLIATMTRVNVARVPAAAEAKTAEDAFKSEDWPPFPQGAVKGGDGSYVHDDTSALLLKEGSEEIDPQLEEDGVADLSTVRSLKGGRGGNEHAHQRRAQFWKEHVRERVLIGRKDLVTTTTFDNGFIDFNTLRLELPYTNGMGFDLKKYWDGQPVRFYCKDKSDDTVFFVVEFTINELKT
ncbi:DUF1769-domain-containing protein [Ceraceosorus guamensis]|uniref:DUF1769-domain-containing protein n=1 Tax=Ceraceosorus guamensis TaxID=1522189 RepID=A0A316VWH0_9BASI|nr:DUF1769-domain-containing protein [Ceraceosorus guamensis]PWN41789.1 DUF1769-domain-containing protein [Ceraceosorus guamensis]